MTKLIRKIPILLNPLESSTNSNIYLEVLKEAPSLFELLNSMVGQGFDAASPGVAVQTLRHWTGDTLASLFGRIFKQYSGKWKCPL